MRKKIIGAVTVFTLALSLFGCAGTEVFEEKPEKPSPISEARNDIKDLVDEKAEEQKVLEEEDTEEIWGNGTNFVKAGDKVYFREYDSKAMETSVMFGELHGTLCEAGKTYIKSFDVNTGEVQKIFEDNGFGFLYYYNGRLYLNGADGWYSVSVDGSDKKPLNLKGDYSSFERVVGKYLFYTSYENDAATLMCINLDNDEEVKLCPIPENELGYPQICQIETVGEDAYVGIEYIAGTGYFYQGGDIYKVSLNGAYDPEIIHEMNTGDETEEYIYIKEDGSFDYGIYAPGSAFMKDSDIWVCDKHGETRCFYKDYGEDTRGYISEKVEGLSFIDDSVYLIHNNMRYTKEDDVGWREAYRVFRSANLRINDKQVVNEFNIVKSDMGEVTAYIYYVHETDENGGTQILLKPMIMVTRDNTELCEKLNLDPNDPESFLDDYAIGDPFYGEAFVASISDNLEYEKVDFYSPTNSCKGGKDDFVRDMLEDPYDMYTMLSLTDLEYEEWINCYVFHEYDYTDENAPYYHNIFAKLKFNEDGKIITGIEEIYLP